MNRSDTLRFTIQRLPKAEIHFHFEGAIPAHTIFQLGQKYRIPEIRAIADAEQCLIFADAHEFFRQFLFVSSLLRCPSDFYLAARDIGVYLTGENIRYVEITIAPHKFVRAGVPYADLLSAVDCGLRESEGGERRDHRFVIDIVRDLGAEAGMEMMRMVERFPHPRVVGIGLGGSEAFPPKDSAKVFAYAAALGLRKTAHAGEGMGADSVWGALQTLGVDRIDHGVRAFEDEELVSYLSRNRIPLNLCPTSNVRLGVVPSISEHPFRMFYEAGIPVNVGTDDPSFFQTTLSEEFENLICLQNFSLHDIPELIENAIHASFLDENEKNKLLCEFRVETRKWMVK
ncbi:MAG: adenosine deaminase [Candidatus Omnitrophota bacterium]|jgi:adenosine deaminase|nr:MAG: adenosine deaminase [Candidatus Omnitrophota bacterium]